MDTSRATITPSVITKVSGYSVAETVERFEAILSARGVRHFISIDQRAEALHAGLELRETVLVFFGNPVAGTPVMDAAPLAALDLPLKVLVWAGEHGTNVSYVAPAAIVGRNAIPDALAHNFDAIGVLTDALVS